MISQKWRKIQELEEEIQMLEARKVETQYTTYTFSLDEEVATKAQEVLKEQGLTLEDALVMFFQWMVREPEEAKKAILRWVNEEKNLI